MKKSPGFIAAGILLLAGVAGKTYAGSASTTIPVTATVVQSCTIGSGTMGFGQYDAIGANSAADLDATGSVTVACTKGASGVSIGIDPGVNSVNGQRYMKGASHGDTLAYNLFQDAAHTTAWDNNTHKFSLTAPTSSASQVLSIYGVVPKSQNISVDSYTDTVTATINY